MYDPLHDSPGFLRRLALLLGQFSLVAVGLHAGADTFDDLATGLYTAVDRFADPKLRNALELIGEQLGYGPRTIERWVVFVLSRFDRDDARLLGIFTALALELLLAAVLAVPMLRPVPKSSLSEAVRAGFTDFTLFRWILPGAVLLTSLAGALFVAVESQNTCGDFAFGLWASHRITHVVGTGAGFLAFLLTFVLLGIPGTLRAALSAHDRTSREEPSRWRRLRGLGLLVIACPLAVSSLEASLPLLAELFVGVVP